MTLEINHQQDSAFRDKIVEILISLRDNHGLKNREISKKIGINENYLSRVLNKDASGSIQLLRGVEMLLEILESQGSEERAKKLEQEMLDSYHRLEPVHSFLSGISSGSVDLSKVDNIEEYFDRVRQSMFEAARLKTSKEKQNPFPPTKQDIAASKLLKKKKPNS